MDQQKTKITLFLKKIASKQSFFNNKQYSINDFVTLRKACPFLGLRPFIKASIKGLNVCYANRNDLSNFYLLKPHKGSLFSLFSPIAAESRFSRISAQSLFSQRLNLSGAPAPLRNSKKGKAFLQRLNLSGAPAPLRKENILSEAGTTPLKRAWGFKQNNINSSLFLCPPKGRIPASLQINSFQEAIDIGLKGQKTIEYSLDSFNRSNQDTCLLHRPAVFEGQWVQSGDLLADCASSVGGELALGQNLLIAYMPWEGYNYEDAILISERLVYDDLYTSVHIEKYELETRETKLGKEEITREIPDILESEITHLDRYGIVKVGSWVEEGDILVGKTTPINKKSQSPYQKLLSTILEKDLLTVRDSSLRAPKGIRAKIVKVQLFHKRSFFQLSSLRQKALNRMEAPSGSSFPSGSGKLKGLIGAGAPFRFSLISAESQNSKKGFAFLKRLKKRELKKKKAISFNSELNKKLIPSSLNKLKKFNENSKKAKTTGSTYYNFNNTIKVLTFNFNKTRNIVRENSRSQKIQKKKLWLKFSNSEKSILKTALERGLIRFKRLCFLNLKLTLSGPEAPLRFSLISAESPNSKKGFAFLKRLNKKLNKIGTKPKFKKSNAHNNLAQIQKNRGFLSSPKFIYSLKKEKISYYSQPFLLPNQKDKNRLHSNSFEVTVNRDKSAQINFKKTKLIKQGQVKSIEAPLAKKTKKVLREIPKSLSSSGLQVHLYLAEKRKVQVGDKLAGRHGNKGIISQILPREDMPYLPDGTPIDMVLNPLGVPSRMNVGQIYECLLGLAGKFLGENYKVFPFDEIYGSEASRSFVYSKLNEARRKTGFNWIFDPNTPGKIRLYDGRTGDCFDQAITVGQAYILRLVHMVDDKIHCLTPDHEVLTTTGWVPINKITINHKVATLTQETGELIYQHPTEVHHYPNFEGSLYYIKNANIDLLVTLNHRMFVKKNRNKVLSFKQNQQESRTSSTGGSLNKNGQNPKFSFAGDFRLFSQRISGAPSPLNRYELIQASQILGQNLKYFKNAKNTASHYQFFLPPIDNFQLPGRKAASLLNAGQSMLFTLPVENLKVSIFEKEARIKEHKAIIPAKTVNMSAWLTFFGIWITEGSVNNIVSEQTLENLNKKSSYTVTISQKKMPIAKVLHNAIKSLGYNFRINKETIHINNKQLWTYLYPLNSSPTNKFLPEWVWLLSESQAQQLLHSICLSDSTFNGNSISYYTSSNKLADDIMRLTLHAGWSANKYLHSEPGFRVDPINGQILSSGVPSAQHRLWRLSIVKTKSNSAANNSLPYKELKIEEIIQSYRGSVHCITVPNQVFYVRRNGFPVWTGNSRSIGPYSLVTQQPLRGRSKQGGQRLGEMEVWALEGYGAAFTLLEMLTLKSDDMTGRMTLWSNLILNGEISIGTPESFKVLICELQALCLDIGLFRVNQVAVRKAEPFLNSSEEPTIGLRSSSNTIINGSSLVPVENLMNFK